MTHEEEILVVRKVDEWYHKHRHLFKTDEIYGINIIADLYNLVKSCVELK